MLPVRPQLPNNPLAPFRYGDHFFEIVVVYDPKSRNPEVQPWHPIDADFKGALREVQALNDREEQHPEFQVPRRFTLRNYSQGNFATHPSISLEEQQELQREAEAHGYFEWEPYLQYLQEQEKRVVQQFGSPVIDPIPDKRIARIPAIPAVYLQYMERCNELVREAYRNMGMTDEEIQQEMDACNASIREARDYGSSWSIERNRRGGSLASIRGRAALEASQAQQEEVPSHLFAEDEGEEVEEGVEEELDDENAIEYYASTTSQQNKNNDDNGEEDGGNTFAFV